MMKFFVFFSVAFVFLPTVVADPVIMNLTMKCDFPEIRHWCTEVLVWERHNYGKHLDYTWQCTSSKTMKFQIILKPNKIRNSYKINHKVFTNCSPLYMKKYQQRCRCYEDTLTQLSVKGQPAISREYNFYTDPGRNMTEKQCEIPLLFSIKESPMLGSNFVDSPCDVAFMMKDLE